ncbi:MAG TPA: hypothetical protein VG892_07775 [Terriglobales bacterium]|nr:hypothetical protein [Terriglobales bacterium]
MDLDKLISDLQRDEGWVPYVYDDANTQRVVPGYRMIGNATVGWGFNFNGAPMTQAEAMPILEGRASKAWDECKIAWPWIENAPEPIQRAVANQLYNMGLNTLQKFTTYLGLLEQGEYEAAATDLETTLWAKQTGSRALRIQALIRSALG